MSEPEGLCTACSATQYCAEHAPQPDLLSALRALEARWRQEAAIHAGAHGDEASIAHGKGLCADDLAVLLRTKGEE